MIDSEKALKIRLLALDVDGVLTDNGVYLGLVNGVSVEFKKFDIQDGLGLAVLKAMGIEVALVSGRLSEATSLRAAELRIAEVIQEPSARKLPAFADLLRRRGLGWEEVAYVGDDLADLPLLTRVGLPLAVANAVEEVKRAAVYVTRASGGSGAVREVVETLLKARGSWDDGVRVYLEERGEYRARSDRAG
ncbi:MAG TPA: HAD hydrolase family protein [Gemmatimonadales bacterium]|jgi:3-deoxy-D-manno-octulosonate 8-phosphate phosphatase (KDO 8-P phosphatase)|nr:HAD hydrolase family protein [Gemmatimonadales bacterium]